jgi:hypothetical protein
MRVFDTASDGSRRWTRDAPGSFRTVGDFALGRVPENDAINPAQ